MTRRRRRRLLTHDRRVLLYSLLAGLVPLIVAVALLWTGDFATRTRWTLGGLAAAWWLLFSLSARETVVRPLQTLSNLLGALREGDFSFRARTGRDQGPLGDALRELNALAQTLREERLFSLEAGALLERVMAEIDVAVFAFDEGGRLRLANRAGAALLGRPVEQLLDRRADELGVAEILGGEPRRVVDVAFPGGAGRYEVRRGTFRQGGRPLELVVLSDLSRTLREEERAAWQRLIRVMGHELNNSLAPIRSIAASLETLLDREPRSPDADADVRGGLAVIGSRAESLGRFMDAYGRLARLPPPKRRRVAVADLARRVAGMETRASVDVRPGPDTEVDADPDQVELVLINLVKNAVEASRESGGGVVVGWTSIPRPAAVELWVDDEGPGPPDTGNLFVPFFTTKPKGSGIGLVLSRQIAEAHGGTLTLAPHPSGKGSRAALRLPRPRRAARAEPPRRAEPSGERR